MTSASKKCAISGTTEISTTLSALEIREPQDELSLIATNHALGHVKKHESWTCQCLACRFAKEFEIEVTENNEKRITNFANIIIESLKREGYKTSTLGAQYDQP